MAYLVRDLLSTLCSSNSLKMPVHTSIHFSQPLTHSGIRLGMTGPWRIHSRRKERTAMPSDLKELTVWGQRNSVTEASFQSNALPFFSPKSKASSAVAFPVLHLLAFVRCFKKDII